ncbi:hypothetical protein OFC37_34225, partial [Escherichia coli]|nr:hypothetical protein [Escherichia coli]
ATDPAAYGERQWARLDRAVRLARERGLRVMIDIAFYAPRWATPAPPPDRPDRERVRPDPAHFADFAEAVARRYGDRAMAFTVW